MQEFYLFIYYTPVHIKYKMKSKLEIKIEIYNLNL